MDDFHLESTDEEKIESDDEAKAEEEEQMEFTREIMYIKEEHEELFEDLQVDFTNSIDHGIEKVNDEYSNFTKSEELEFLNVENKFSCNQCQFVCNQMCKLTNHTLIHSNPNPNEPKIDIIVKEEPIYVNNDSSQSIEEELPMPDNVEYLQCNKCDFSCKQISELKSHRKTHSKKTKFHCNQCDYKSGKLNNLKRHKITHTGQNLFTKAKLNCNDNDLINNVSKESKYFHCDDCDYKSFQLSYLKRHRLSHTSDKKCDSEKRRPEKLKIHQEEESSPLDTIEEKPLQCDQCDFKCKRMNNLKNHMLIHTEEKPFACDECDLKFNQMYKLKRHKPTHTGLKPFQCDQCDFVTGHKSTLNRHKFTHSDEKHLQCEECNYRCNRRSLLSQHKVTHSEERRFECDQCNYRFKLSHDLKCHKLLHTGEKPFSCDQCDFKCSRIGNLNVHKFIHTGQKPFRCDQCDYKTTGNSMLKRHKLTHTDEKLFQCDECDHRCKQINKLKRHKLIHKRRLESGAPT